MFVLLAVSVGMSSLAKAADAPSTPPANSASPAVALDPLVVIANKTSTSLNPITSPTDGVLGDTRSLLDTPRAVGVLTPALIEQQNIDTISKIAIMVPGVYAPASYGLLTTPLIRGDTAETYVNGQRLGYNNYGYLPSFNSVEAIDVVRGPASAVFGSGYLVGGYVNYRTKQPAFDGPHTELTTRLGSWVPGGDSFAHGSFQLDHTAPISDKLAFRVSYEGQGGDTYYKKSDLNDDRQDLFFALTWKPSSDLRVDANAQIFWQNTPETLGVNRITQDLIDHHIYQSDLGPVKLDRDAILFQPSDHADAWVGRAQVVVTRDLTPESSLTNRTLIERVNREREHLFGYHEDVEATTLDNRTEYQQSFEASGFKQKILAGVSLRYEHRSAYADYDYGTDAGSGAPLLNYDITNPATITRPAVATYERSLGDIVNPALFWQQEIKLTDQLTALAGWREDFYLGKLSGNNGDGYGGTNIGSDDLDFNAFSQSYSLSYAATDELSFYTTYNHMQTLGTNGSAVGGGYFFTGPSVNAKDFSRPSELIEVGAKTNLFADRLFASAALFQQKRSRDDFGAPSDITVRGLELATTYQPTRAWSLFANATFQHGNYDNADIFQLADASSPTYGASGPGDWDLVGFSDVMLNGGVNYTFDNGFGVGLRGSWQSQQNVNMATATLPQMTIPAQFELDAALFYKAENWSASIEILNLTGEQNWIHNGDAYTGAALISQSLPLRIDATVRMRF